MTHDEILQGAVYELLQVTLREPVLVGYWCTKHGRIDTAGCPACEATKPETKPCLSTEAL